MGLNRSTLPAATARPAPDRAALLEALGDESAAARRSAARSLGDRSENAAALLECLAHEQDRSVQETLLSSLTEVGDIEVARTLTGYLDSDDAWLRNAVIEALQGMPEATAGVLDELLRHDDPDLRIFAVNVLAGLRLARTTDWLAGVFQTETHLNVCAAAIDVAAEVGTPEMGEALRALVLRFPDEPFIAFAVDAALRRIGGGNPL
jgi:HEAT repeat protein